MERLRRAWVRLRSSYWFIPALMSLGAFLLAITAPRVDALLGSEWIETWRFLGPNRPEGARSLLSTVAGSMITVAGVTFSVTIVAVAYATSQYGPRLLTNFMRDTGNQVTLGAFTSTYLYCIVVLRVIRAPESGAAEAASFVPHLAILVALVLSVLSLAVLIYFFHHVPESIHAANVVGDVGRRLQERISEAFPSRAGEPAGPEGAEDFPAQYDPEWSPVCVEGGGYLQFIAAERVLDLAETVGLRVHVTAMPGSFVRDGGEVCRVWPRTRVDADVERSLRDCFSRGNRRTDEQDVVFLLRELVEIAARALSPGTNDPFTAISCMDWMTNALTVAGRGRPPSPYRVSADGVARIIAPVVDFDLLSDVALGGVRPYAASDRNAALHLAGCLTQLGQAPIAPRARKIVDVHAELFAAACERGLPLPADREAVKARLALR